MCVLLSGAMVAALPRLCVFDVSCNPQLTQEVDTGGFRELVASFSHASSLTTLRLQACGLTADSLDVLGRWWGIVAQLPFTVGARKQNYFLNSHMTAISC